MLNADHPLAQLIKSGRPVIGDGAMGTLLNQRGVSFDQCFDELNLTRPALVADIHREYIEAGAQLIQTNTFGANRYKLAQHGLEDRLVEINRAGVDLARRVVLASFRPVLIAGDVGPLGVRLAPFGRVQPEQARQAFCEQIEALANAGVDLLIFETMNLYETRGPPPPRASEPRPAGRFDDLHPGRPHPAGGQPDKDRPRAPCRRSGRDRGELLGRAQPDPAHPQADAPGGARRPLLGHAQRRLARTRGRANYVPGQPGLFQRIRPGVAKAGACLIGGCCGTTPRHIEVMRRAVETTPLESFQNGLSLTVVEQEEAAHAAEQPTQLAQHLSDGKFVIAVEMDPPRGLSTQKIIAGASLLQEAGATVINVADSPMARMRMSPWAVCSLIQQKVGIETVLHFPTRGRNLLRVQGALLAAHTLGVRNVFVVMGDPTAIGDYPEAMDNYDLVPSGLIKLIKHGFNVGLDHAGANIGQPTSFFVGCALNLNPSNPESEIKNLKRKIASGADFILTQPVYDVDTARFFRDRIDRALGGLELPIIVGLLPLVSGRHAAFLQHEVPGITIPEPVYQRMQAAGENAARVGIEIAIELIRQLRSDFQGVYLMPAFNRFDYAAEIIEAVRA